MRKEFNFMNRGTGDCNIAGPEYEYILDSAAEAQGISNAIHKEFKLKVKPVIRIMRKSPKRLRGSANSTTGLIKLMGNGCNVGVLLHELAHLDKTAAEKSRSTGLKYVRGRMTKGRRISHGPDFKYAQSKIIKFWRSELKSKFYNGKERVSIPDIKSTKLKQSAGLRRPYILPVESDFTVKPIEKPVEDTADDIKELIEVAVEGIAKLTFNNMITMGGLVRAMRVRGVNNTPENRAYARKHAVEIVGLTINTKY